MKSSKNADISKYLVTVFESYIGLLASQVSLLWRMLNRF